MIKFHRGNQAFLAVVVIFGGYTSQLSSQTDVTWSTATSANWTTAVRWNPAVVPNNGNPPGSLYNASISLASGTFGVTLNSGITVNSLVLDSPNGTLSHTAGTLTSTNPFILASGTYNIAGGTLRNTTLQGSGGSLVVGTQGQSTSTFDNVNCSANVVISGGILSAINGTAFSGNITVPIQTGIYFYGGPGSTPGNYRLETGRQVQITGGTLGITDNTTFTVSAGALVTGTLVNVSGPGRLVNDGTMATMQGSTNRMTLSGFIVTGSLPIDVVNNGTIEIAAGSSFFTDNSKFLNNGLLHVRAGQNQFSTTGATLRGNWTNQGIIRVENFGFVNLGGNFLTSGIGTIERTAGSTVRLEGTWDNTGTTYNMSAIGLLVGNSGGIVGGEIDNSADLLRGALFLRGGVRITGGMTVDNTWYILENSTFSGVANVSGRLDYRGGSTSTQTTFQLNDCSVMLLGGSGDLSANTGMNLVIGPNVSVQGFGRISGGAAGSDPFTWITNRGLIDSQALIEITALRFRNEGLISVGASKTVRFTGQSLSSNVFEWINSGTIEVANGGTLGSTILVSTGQLRNEGLIVLNGGRLFVNGSTTFGQLAGGELRMNGGLIDASNAGVTVTIAAGSLTGNGTVNTSLIIGGTLAPGLSAGRFNMNKDLTLQGTAGTTLEIDGILQGVAGGYDYIAVTNLLQLGGQLEVMVGAGFEQLIQPTDVFTVFTSGNLMGQFANALPQQYATTTDGRFRFLVHYGAGSPFNNANVVLTGFEFTTIPEPGIAWLVMLALIAGTSTRRSRLG